MDTWHTIHLPEKNTLPDMLYTPRLLLMRILRRTFHKNFPRMKTDQLDTAYMHPLFRLMSDLQDMQNTLHHRQGPSIRRDTVDTDHRQRT